MKTMKKVLSIALALLLVAALAVPALAAPEDGDWDDNSVTITIEQPDGSEFAENAPEYELYKVFDVTAIEDGTVDLTTGEPVENGLSYTWDGHGYFSALATKYKEMFDMTQVNNNLWIINGTTDTFDVEEFAAAYVERVKQVTEGQAGSPWTRKGRGPFEVDPGYYIIASSLGTKMMVDTIGKKEVTITEKNQLPTLQFGITSVDHGTTLGEPETLTDGGGKVYSEGTATYGHENRYEMGTGTGGFFNNPVHWRTYVQIPVTAKGDITVEVTGANIWINNAPRILDTAPFQFTRTENDGGDSLTITIPAANVEKLVNEAKEAGKQFVYVTADFFGDLMPTDTEGNAVDNGTMSAQLTYSGYTTPKVDTVVYTYDVDVVKTDKDGKLLDGAKFQLLYPGRVVSGGDIVYDTVKLSQRADGVYYVDPENGTTDPFEAGKIQIQGLGSIEFQLKEVEAPAGYNALDSNVKYTPTADNFATLKAEETDKYDNGLQVINYTGAELPSTGGIGTTIFYIVGGLLVAGAAVLLVTKKRVQA